MLKSKLPIWHLVFFIAISFSYASSATATTQRLYLNAANQLTSSPYTDVTPLDIYGSPSLNVEFSGQFATDCTSPDGWQIEGGLIVGAADSSGGTTADFLIELKKNGTSVGNTTVTIAEDGTFKSGVFYINISDAICSTDTVSLQVSSTAGANEIRALRIDADYPLYASVDFRISSEVPQIDSQPCSTTAINGETATFSVSARGGGLSYQWKKNGVTIPGANSANYTTPILSLADDGTNYQCTITNNLGTIDSTSASLTVTNAAAPLPGYYIGSNCQGKDFWLHVNDDLVVDEYFYVADVFDEDNSKLYETSVTHFFAPGYEIPITDNMFSYDAQAGNPEKDKHLVSGSFTVDGLFGNFIWEKNVSNPADTETTYQKAFSAQHETLMPPFLTDHPLDTKVTVGEQASFSANAVGWQLTYQWQKNGVDIPGATSRHYTTPEVQNSDNGALYRCVISNDNGSVTTGPATLTVGKLRLDSIEQTLGEVGINLDNTLYGTGFDANTRVSMALDNGNQRRTVGEVSGLVDAWDVQVIENTAYLVDRRDGLKIIDITNPKNPWIIGAIDQWFSPTGVVLHDKNGERYAFVVGYAGLYVFNVSDPANPIRKASLGGLGWPQAVTRSGDYLYIADGNGGLQVVNISDPVNPAKVTSLSTAPANPQSLIGVTTDIEVNGTLLYLASSEHGLQLVDISTPGDPNLITYLPTSQARRLAVKGNTVFVADEIDGLLIIDVTNPETPNKVSTLPFSGTPAGVALQGESLLVTGSNGLHSVDISDLNNPKVTETVLTKGQAKGVAAKGNMAVVASTGSGMQIIDMGSTAVSLNNPGFSTPGTANSIVVEGNYAYIADGESGLQVLDVTDPYEPVNVTSINTSGTAESITIVGDILYLADGEEGFKIISIANPGAPVLNYSVPTDGYCYDVAVSGTIAYVADGSNGFLAFDITNPANPVSLGKDPTVKPRALAISGDILYVAVYSSDPGNITLDLWDISTPDTPVYKSSAQTGFSAVGIKVSGNYAYVAKAYDFYDLPENSGGFEVFNVSNPDAPYQVAALKLEHDVQDVSIQGDYAYVANGHYGCQVIDISDPLNPVIMADMPTPGQAMGIAIKGSTVIVADNQGITSLPHPVEIPIDSVTSTTISLTIPGPDIPGHYSLRTFDLNDSSTLDGAVSFTENSASLSAKAIIVAGGGPGSVPDMWSETEKAANFAYSALRYQGFSAENIYYLNADPLTGTDGVDAVSTYANLRQTITNWGSTASEVLVYFVDHGTNGSFGINESETLDAETLNTWFNTLQNAIPGRLIFVYDACQSGTFIPKLLPPQGKERIIITSAGSEAAYFLNYGTLSFSYQFWANIYGRPLLDDAFYAAKNIMKSHQTAQVDANGNGMANEDGDKNALNGIIIGRAYQTVASRPVIGQTMGNTNLNSPMSLTLWANDINSPNGVISRVFAEVISPDYQVADLNNPVTTLPTIELTDPDQDGAYEGTSSDINMFFDVQGTYILKFYAVDEMDVYSDPYYVLITQANGNPPQLVPDEYEDDNSKDLATNIVLNDSTPQHHTFHVAGDVDWVKFYGIQGETYHVKASNPSIITDPHIAIYSENGSSPLSTTDIGSAGEEELLEWVCNANGIYYVKITNNSGHYGATVSYDLKLKNPKFFSLPGYVSGTVSSSGAGGIGGAILVSGGGSALSLPNGSYIMALEAGDHSVTVSKEGYLAATFSVSIPGGGTTTKNVSLTAIITNKPPTISGTPPTSAALNTLYTFIPFASDPDGDTLVFSVTGLPSWASFSTSSGTLTGVPDENDIGSYGPIVISVSDSKETVSLSPFTINVTQDGNQPPTISGNPPTTVGADRMYSFSPWVSDPDGDSMSLFITNKPSWANFTGGRLYGIPGNANIGVHGPITITVQDDKGAGSTLPPFFIEVVPGREIDKYGALQGVYMLLRK